MLRFDDKTLDALDLYAEEMRGYAQNFYDVLDFQPKQSIKDALEIKHHGFHPLETALGFHKSYSLGDQAKIIVALEERDFVEAMAFEKSENLFSFILKDKNDKWSVLRTNCYSSAENRDKNPVVLQSEKIQNQSNAVEIIPLTPSVDLYKLLLTVSPSSRIVAPVLERQFTQAGLFVKNMNNLGLLPNGQIVFVDPSNSRRMDKTQTAQQLHEQFADFRDVTKDRPQIHNLLDYVQPNGIWTQNLYFPALTIQG